MILWGQVVDHVGIKIHSYPRQPDPSHPAALSENRSADDLAVLGYRVERNPASPHLSSNPDLKIEGQFFDVKTPQGSSIRSFVANNIEKKIGQSGGRFVVPISPGLSTKFTPDDFIKQLTDYPVSGLREVIILLPDGTVRHFVP